MFKERIRKVLELVLEVEEKTNSYVSCEYDTRTKVLIIITDKDVLTMSECEYLQEEFEKIQNHLEGLISEEDTGKHD
jgi:hypothetical protein